MNVRSQEESLPEKFTSSCWQAGLKIGRGEDARPLLDALKEIPYPTLDPDVVSRNIFQGAPLSAGRNSAAWVELWPSVERDLDEFLADLEKRAQALFLARRTRLALERMILEHLPDPRPITIGTTHAVRIEISDPISDILSTLKAERLFCTVECEGTNLGMIELSICAGRSLAMEGDVVKKNQNPTILSGGQSNRLQSA